MRLTITLLLLLCLNATGYAAPLNENEQQLARRLFVTLGCRACHDFEKSSSTLAGSLDRIGLKLGETRILELLLLPPGKIGHGDKFMPSYQTTPIEQLKLLSRFLAERK
jgi:hypothetical protein